MKIHTARNIALTLVLAFAFALVLSWPRDDIQSDAADEAIKTHHAEIRALRAAMEMCAVEGALAHGMGDGVWQCLKEQKVVR